MKIPWIFHQDYDIPLPKNHRFSSSKFGDLYTLLIDTELSKDAEVFIPAPAKDNHCLLYTSPSPRDLSTSRMPSSA